jgi:hypothetical protein
MQRSASEVLMSAQSITEQKPEVQRSKHSRRMLAPLLILAVIILLVVAARVGIPSGPGIERDPSETAPAEPAPQ